MDFVEYSEGKSSLERPRRRWKSNSELDLRDMQREGVSWINLAQDTDKCWAVVNTVFP
jgi:hypothetical protein